MKSVLDVQGSGLRSSAWSGVGVGIKPATCEVFYSGADQKYVAELAGRWCLLLVDVTEHDAMQW